MILGTQGAQGSREGEGEASDQWARESRRVQLKVES
jgi:hypothetical protein